MYYSQQTGKTNHYINELYKNHEIVVHFFKLLY